MPNHQVMRFQHASAPARRASPAPWGGRPAAQAGGEALARAAALAVAAAAAGDAAPAELLDAHLEAAATHNPVQDPGLHPGAPHEGAQPAAAAGAPAADAAAAPARGAGPGAELGPERAGSPRAPRRRLWRPRMLRSARATSRRAPAAFAHIRMSQVSQVSGMSPRQLPYCPVQLYSMEQMVANTQGWAAD